MKFLRHRLAYYIDRLSLRLMRLHKVGKIESRTCGIVMWWLSKRKDWLLNK